MEYQKGKNDLAKEYALYDTAEFEQLVFMGTLKDIANYLNCEVGSLRSFLTRKKNKQQELLQRRYDMVEVMDTEIEEPLNIIIKDNKDFWKTILNEFTPIKVKFEIFDEFNWLIKGLKDQVIGEEEIWKKIPEFEYSISNYGHIRNDKNNKLKATRIKNYMRVVDLYKDGKRYMLNVVRMEANLFIRPVLKSERIRHIDGDSRNNFVNNLEIVCK